MISYIYYGTNDLERAIIKTADGGEADIGSIVEWALGLV